MNALEDDRQALIEASLARVSRWSDPVDALLRACEAHEHRPRELAGHLEALRNKRDCAVTKVAALGHHRCRGWPRARGELAEAERELREAWRVILNVLHREGLFV